MKKQPGLLIIIFTAWYIYMYMVQDYSVPIIHWCIHNVITNDDHALWAIYDTPLELTHTNTLYTWMHTHLLFAYIHLRANSTNSCESLITGAWEPSGPLRFHLKVVIHGGKSVNLDWVTFPVDCRNTARQGSRSSYTYVISTNKHDNTGQLQYSPKPSILLLPWQWRPCTPRGTAFLYQAEAPPIELQTGQLALWSQRWN